MGGPATTTEPLFWLHLILSLVAPPLGITAVPTPHSVQGRQSFSLDDQWRFLRADVGGAESSQFDDSNWERVNHLIPTMRKTANLAAPTIVAAWYRRALVLTERDATRRYFLQFDGAALATDVWVNDRHTGDIYGVRASLHFTTRLVNSGIETVRARVCFGLRDAHGLLLKRLCQPVTIAAGQALPIEQLTRLLHPHRWDGTWDRYLYSVTADIVNLWFGEQLGQRRYQRDGNAGCRPCQLTPLVLRWYRLNAACRVGERPLHAGCSRFSSNLAGARGSIPSGVRTKS